MEMEDVATVGVVALILFMLLQNKKKIEPFGPSVPVEQVDSTITYPPAV